MEEQLDEDVDDAKYKSKLREKFEKDKQKSLAELDRQKDEKLAEVRDEYM